MRGSEDQISACAPEETAALARLRPCCVSMVREAESQSGGMMSMEEGGKRVSK